MTELEKIWSTADEIRFFKSTSPMGITKLQFLINYKEAISHRNRWGTLDKKKIMTELNKEVKLLKGE